jgi:serine protease AprX
VLGTTVRRTRLAGAATLAALVAAVGGGGAPALAGPPVPGPAGGTGVAVAGRADEAAPLRVVVRGAPGAGAALDRAVETAGGRVTRRLPVVHGLAATLPPAGLPALARSDVVTGLTPDAQVAVQGTATQDVRDPVHLRETGVLDARAAGATGQGVTVALVDTGVAEVPDLAGRIVEVTDDRTGSRASCQNLSGEDGCGDSYGHGTFIAGLIAGDGTASAGQHTGAAPGARILSVKVAGRDGTSDVSTVLAAIQWVVSFRDRYDIEVLNLSLGTDSTEPWHTDPLNYAVERAWDAGITVVVSAANLGPEPGTVTKPADDPLVLTVGSVDDRATPAVDDDRLPAFSSRGPTRDGLAKPDVVAPGAHLASLRAPGSLIEELYGDSADGAYRRGSGTSMSAGVVSGAVALLLQQRPDLSPDQVKALLRSTARPVASPDPMAVGAGLVDVPAALAAPAPAASQTRERSSGLGTLDASRGTLRLRLDDPMGTLLTGRQTAQLALWDPLGFTGLTWSAPTWYSSVHATLGWNTASFDELDWTGHNWTGHNWTGSSWYGEVDDTSPYGRPARGSAWYGAWD